MREEMRPEAELVDLLRSREWTVTTVESCTGGGISARIVDIPGASDVLRMAFVTYCDEAKTALAGVSPETLRKHTAVSAETAEEMARGGAARADADLCLSATGIAGPGGTKEFPAGLVYLGCFLKGEVRVEKHLFSGDRNEVREQAAERAIQMAVDALKGYDRP